MQESEIKNKKQLQIQDFKGLPFKYATNGERNYIICGRVLYETELNSIEAYKWLTSKPWEAIALLCESFITEFNNNKNN